MFIGWFATLSGSRMIQRRMPELQTGRQSDEYFTRARGRIPRMLVHEVISEHSLVYSSQGAYTYKPFLGSRCPRCRSSTSRIGGASMNTSSVPSRRFSTRVETSQDVWVYWNCRGRDDLSRVRNLSAGGLFLETKTRIPVGVKSALHFLVPEGKIRADALVLRAEPHCGIGMKFIEVKAEDRKNLEALFRRSRDLARPAVMGMVPKTDHSDDL